MKRKLAIITGCAALALAASAVLPAGGTVTPLGAIGTAAAAVSKSMGQGGGGGDISGAGDRLLGLASDIGVPVIIAVAGFFLVGTLAQRNVGASFGVVLISLVGLIFLLSPQSIESLAKGIANTVF